MLMRKSMDRPELQTAAQARRRLKNSLLPNFPQIFSFLNSKTHTFMRIQADEMWRKMSAIERLIIGWCGRVQKSKRMFIRVSAWEYVCEHIKSSIQVLMNLMTDLTLLILLYTKDMRNNSAFVHNYIDLMSSDEEDNRQQRSGLKRGEVKQSVLLQQQAKSLTIDEGRKFKMEKKFPYSSVKEREGRFTYDDVCGFNQIVRTSGIIEQYRYLSQFLENVHKNILFIFGPSGCGKTIFTTSALQQNQIKYQFAEGKVQEDEAENLLYQDTIDMLYRMLSSKDMINQNVFIFKEYPIASAQNSSFGSNKYKCFREKAFELLQNCYNRNKYIFILNTQIYSAFYLLNEGSQERSISKHLKNVSVIKMEGYRRREMGMIIERFLKVNSEYCDVVNGKKNKEEIITEANGDARKALNLIYHRKIKDEAVKHPCKRPKVYTVHFQNEHSDISQHDRKITKTASLFGEAKADKQQKQQLRYGIFHTLGKFLYGKRYNIYYNPAGKKKDNQISAYYTEQQLKQLDPKFYFKPVQLFQKSGMSLNTFVDLIQQNFIDRYGKVRDVGDMYDVFRFYDSYLWGCLNRFELLERMEESVQVMLSWGVVVYNRNAQKGDAKSLVRIQRSKNNVSLKLLRKKMDLIRSHFTKFKVNEGVYRSRVKDVILYAYYIKDGIAKQGNRNANIKANFYSSNFYVQTLVNIVFSSSSRQMYGCGDVDKDDRVLQDDEQMTYDNLSKITQFQKSIIQHKKQLTAIFDDVFDSERQQIDSD